MRTEATETRISPFPEIEKDTVIGVWLIILTPNNKLLVVENLINKYVSQKVNGQWNSPAETYEEPDGTFEKTIQRAIGPEIGLLDYDPTQIKRIGIIYFNKLGRKVAAVPYLIPVKNEKAVVYDPQEPENGESKWINLAEVTEEKSLTIGPHQVPLYRSPMIEIVDMLLAFQKTDTIQTREVGLTIPQEVYDYLEQNPRTDISTE